ncbi:glycosyltransferase [Actinoplanes hulinensis]|uniref:Glycosyltransferase n=1 Tax=Actinoplanes hulinensis TaxID=1144547 RepID=A0ABS7B586_9ACTN|nr:glycosyltransferase [Actinoplanes hulinensis]MBW6435458.1 glycosyltransferase [Actinoplanes hulinensis]
MIVLIPAYQPGLRLAELVGRLGHHRVVVVDDGSGPPYAEMFERARRAGAEVITLDRNRGKGFALRTGFAHIGARCPGELATEIALFLAGFAIQRAFVFRRSTTAPHMADRATAGRDTTTGAMAA